MKATHFKTFDVRPLLARGEEPFAAIRARVDSLAARQGNLPVMAWHIGRVTVFSVLFVLAGASARLGGFPFS